LAVRAAEPIMRANDELFGKKAELEKFLYERVYRNPSVIASRRIAQDQLRAMFQGYLRKPELMPAGFIKRAETDGVPRSVCDYLAGMTDRYCQTEFQRLFAM
jgi:dGTPase